MALFEKLNPTKEITVGSKTYKVTIARTNEEKETGLSNIDSLPEDEGMLFVYEEPQPELYYTMMDTSIDLDIIFIDEEGTVISVNTVEAYDEEPIYEENAQFVLEVNANSGIEEGDELDEYDDEDEDGSDLTEDERKEVSSSKMLVLNENGDVQMKLEGGERIVSIIETKKLIRASLRAFHSDNESDYRKVGKLIFKILDGQDNREAEYVEAPE